MTLTILSRSNRIDQDVTDVRVKTDDWEGTLAISGLEEVEAGSLEAAIEAKLKSRGVPSATLTAMGPLEFTGIVFKEHPLDEDILARMETIEPGKVTYVDLTDGEFFKFRPKRIDKIAKY